MVRLSLQRVGLSAGSGARTRVGTRPLARSKPRSDVCAGQFGFAAARDGQARSDLLGRRIFPPARKSLLRARNGDDSFAPDGGRRAIHGGDMYYGFPDSRPRRQDRHDGTKTMEPPRTIDILERSRGDPRYAPPLPLSQRCPAQRRGSPGMKERERRLTIDPRSAQRAAGRSRLGPRVKHARRRRYAARLLTAPCHPNPASRRHQGRAAEPASLLWLTAKEASRAPRKRRHARLRSAHMIRESKIDQIAGNL